jgi:hypothetical protein
MKNGSKVMDKNINLKQMRKIVLDDIQTKKYPNNSIKTAKYNW